MKNVVKVRIYLAKAISDCGWSEFTRQLKYKAEFDGKTYLEINRFFPSSKICHVGLNQIDSLSLDVHSWTCPSCKTHHDRNVNAAINIRRDEGLRILALGTSATAQGGNVRPASGTQASHLWRLLLLSWEAPSPCGRGSSLKVLFKKVKLGGSTNLEYNTIKVFRHSLKRKMVSEPKLILKGHLKIPSVISNGYIFIICKLHLCLSKTQQILFQP
jgi:hypothetical protein